jgi:serine/threonine-protein kinase
MSDVFVSYKAEDRRRVKPLVEALESEGYSVWWDEQIGGGAQWRSTIDSELNSAQCVIVAWSKRSVSEEGTFVQDEATRAQQRHVYVPVLIDKVHLPLGFGETQALPLVGWHGNRSDPRYEAVLAAVRRCMGGKARPRRRPLAAAPGIDRRTVIAGGAVATAAIAGVGGWALLKPSASAARSIAVLPFANLSGDPSQDYFSDGIAEELRSALSRLADLKVVGRTSSEAVGKEDAETAAKKLGVVNILTGSVRRTPSVVRVAAQLVDGRTGLERWSEVYDRAPGDAIKIQTDIAQNVAQALSIALGGSAGSSLTIGGTTNAEAHNLVLQSREAMDQRTKEDTDRAIELVTQAIQLDPNYADAYARKAIYLMRRGNSYASNGAELARYRAAAVPFAQKALSIAPKAARGHFALAVIYQNQFNIDAAWSQVQQVVQLAPGDADYLSFYSFFVSRLGDQAESLRSADKVLELNPLDPDSYANKVGALFDARRYSDAVAFAEAAKRKSPDLFADPLLLGICLVMAGRLREAQEQFAMGKPEQWERLAGEAIVFARSGNKAAVEQKVQRMQQLFGDAASYQYAEIFAQAGDKERALASMDSAWAIRDGGLINIRVDPFLDPIRNEPRFQAIVEKMNFPD